VCVESLYFPAGRVDDGRERGRCMETGGGEDMRGVPEKNRNRGPALLLIQAAFLNLFPSFILPFPENLSFAEFV
jgi:hypothetical protein